MQWSNGPATAVRVFSDQVVEVRAPDCPQAEHLAAAVMSRLDDAPLAAAARHSLLYRPDEPDTAATGPCIDAFDGDKPGYCMPYRKVRIPPSSQEIIAAAAANPNVECAVALGPVHIHLGQQMSPTTNGSPCRFIEPTHTVRLEINSSGIYRPDEYGDEPDLYQNRKKIDVAGHPAIYFEFELPDTRIEYHVYASPGSDTSAPGFVHVLLELSPPRGTASGTPIDTSLAPTFEKITSDIMAAHSS